MADIKKLQKNIKSRNLLATTLIAILVSASFLSLMVLFKHQEKDAEIINIAGSQRMLSQRIALFSYLHYNNLAANINDESIQKSLFNTANLFASNQKYLTDFAVNEPNTVPQEVASMYLNAPIKLNKRVELYVKSAVALSLTQNLYVAEGIIKPQFDRNLVEDLLKDLNQVVSTIEQHVQKRIAYIEILQFALWIATLLSLILISFFIFRPLQRLISKNYKELNIAKQQAVELNRAINKHAIVYRVSMNKKGTITEVNERFSEFYCYSDKDIIGKSVFTLCSDTYTTEFYETVFKQCIENEFWHGESINIIKGGRELWLDTTIVPLINSKERIESFIVIQNDISGIKQTEIALNQLHKITSNVDKTLTEKVQDILMLGKQLFSLPLALISEVHDQEYRVAYCNTPNGEISSGETFELGNTYCCHTLRADKPIAFHQAGTSEIKEHPCYLGFGLESYIGVPLVVNGKRLGTLNFSGPEPSSRPFNEFELDLIQLFAHWINSELTRADHENKLLAQQSLMEQMGQQARIGAWEVNMVNDNIYWSDVTKEIHEVPSDYQPNLATAINFYKEGKSRDTIQALVEKCMEDGLPYEQELQIVTAKGNEIWVSSRLRSEFENGKCVRLFGSFQDITDRVNSQQKIAAHHQRMSLATDSAGIGVWEFNIITNELKWDDWMFKLYGVAPDEFSDIYEAWEERLHKDDIERATDEMHEAIANRGKFRSQFRIVWPSGTIKYMKAAAIVIYDSEDKPISMIGVNYDVTKRVENEIALTKAKEEAEIAVTAKNEFFASMSHEIRTPMNGVIGMLDLVKESKLNQEQKHRVGIAQESAKSLLSLINDVLDFSKIDANKLDLENVSFNLTKMVGDMAGALAQEAQNKGLELIVDLVNVEESLVMGDSNRIRQILTNLTANAIKFTKQGEVIVRLRQQEHSNSHWHIIIEISDTGIGISKDKQEAVFEAFSQVDASTTREYGGTGLGLAIVKKLCLCMQGSIRVESNEARGSVFICDLLLEKSPDSLLLLPDKALHNKRVLIIENNESCGEIIKQQLESWQLNVQIVTSGQQALTILQAENSLFDLVIMNKQMPDIEALAFVKSIRTYPTLASLKIMLMTLMTSQNDLANYTRIGINGHFTKPVTPYDLYQALHTMLNADETKQINNILSQDVPLLTPKDLTWAQNVRLLLVEDNRVNQMVALGVLKKIGIKQCVVAVNGKDAIEKLELSDENNPFTFIFMDCQMPVMDGYEATKLIREGFAGERYKDLPIVAMTANAMVGDEQKCLAAGMNDYLVKPINKEKVRDTLKIFLGNEN